MIEFTPCKINLGLHITAKRDDGFHELSTVMYPIFGKADIVEIQRSGGDFFTSSGIVVDCAPSDNLCIKALELLRQTFDIPPVHIHLHKQTPFGAGLGGGSANATGVLKLCNREFSLNLTDKQLEELAAQLGSDTSFFVRNVPQLATGRGEILKPVEVDLSPYHIYIVKPPVLISTKEAYRGVTPKIPDLPLQEIIKEPVTKWREMLKNDFEDSLLVKNPVLKEIKEQLYALGALYASLSGSGSALYGIFERELAEKPLYFWHVEISK